MGPGHQFEILAAEVRPEIADRSRAAPAIVDVERCEADAIDALAVEIGVVLILQAFAGLDKGLRHRRRTLDVGNRDRTPGAAPLIRAVDAMLHPLEIGQYVLVAPAPGAQPLPLVIVARRASQKHQPVDGARPAHHLAARPDDAAAAQPRLRLGFVAPVDFRVGDELAEAPGNMDPGIAVAPAGLDHAQRNPGVFRQPCRHHASGRSGAGHHDVEFHIEPGFCHDGPSARICAGGVPRSLPAIMVSPYGIRPQPPPSAGEVGSDRPDDARLLSVSAGDQVIEREQAGTPRDHDQKAGRPDAVNGPGVGVDEDLDHHGHQQQRHR